MSLIQRDKAVVLSGVNGHLGRFILLKIIKFYNVIGISRNASKAVEIIPKEYKSSFFPLNLDYKTSSTKEVSYKIKTLLDLHEFKLVGLVNNGITGYPKGAEVIDRESVALSAEGIFAYHIRFAIDLSSIMQNPSSIINISSMYGKVAPNHNLYDDVEVNPLLYGSMKAALIQASKYLSSMLACKGIRVNSVSYGPFPSKIIQEQNISFVNKLAEKTHFKRIGNPKEAAGVINFLLSNDSSYITGADIPVDGGWTAW